MAEVCIHCIAEFPHPPTELCIKTADEVEQDIKQVVANSVGRPQKDAKDMLDPISTGRKRAAEALPAETLETMICEWALLKEAGGGIYPIAGCHGNKATDRHHGPDKSTLNNERRVNLHGICSFCHNEWHAKNDLTYAGERPEDNSTWLPVGDYKLHNPDGPRMTIQEALIKELTRYGKR